MVTRVWEIDLAYTGYLKPIRVENARSWLFYYNNDGYIYSATVRVTTQISTGAPMRTIA